MKHLNLIKCSYFNNGIIVILPYCENSTLWSSYWRIEKKIQEKNITLPQCQRHCDWCSKNWRVIRIDVLPLWVIDKLIKFGKHSNCVSAWGDDADTKYNIFRKTAEIFHLNYQMKVLLLIFKTKRYLFISYSIYEVVSKSVKWFRTQLPNKIVPQNI